MMYERKIKIMNGFVPWVTLCCVYEKRWDTAVTTCVFAERFK